MRILIWKVTVAALVAFATVGTVARGQSEGVKQGALTVYIVSTNGGELPAGRLGIESTRGRSVYSSPITGQITTRLPYGDYVASFRSEFLKPVRREVTIDQEDTFLVLATNMEGFVLDIPHDAVSISVRAQPSGVCTPGGFLWAKLTGVFSDYTAERKISPGGYVLFEPVEVGTYVVMVVDGQTVRATQALKTWGQVTTVNVALPDCNSAATSRRPLPQGADSVTPK